MYFMEFLFACAGPVGSQGLFRCDLAYFHSYFLSLRYRICVEQNEERRQLFSFTILSGVAVRGIISC